MPPLYGKRGGGGIENRGCGISRKQWGIKRKGPVLHPLIRNARRVQTILASTLIKDLKDSRNYGESRYIEVSIRRWKVTKIEAGLTGVNSENRTEFRRDKKYILYKVYCVNINYNIFESCMSRLEI